MKHNGPHWRAPAVMLSSLLIGTALAIGHHAFYASLAGTAVSSDPIKVVGWTTTQQQINVAVGTAFAFVVKASLILACSTAYMQLLFGAINRESFRLEVLDNWFGGLNDFWSFMCVGTYWRYPLLTLAALTCWLLPIAAIISPAALSVVFDQISPSPTFLSFVPQPAFDSLAFGKFTSNDLDGGNRLSYQGPREEVSRIAFASAAQGAVLPIEPPGTNATWQTTITTPRLACVDIEANVREDIKESLIGFFNNATGSENDWSWWTTIMFNYIAWCAYSDDESPVPFKDLVNDGWRLEALVTSGTRHPYQSGVGMDMFFSIIPRSMLSLPLQNHGLPLNVSSINKAPEAVAADKKTLMDWYFEDATMLRCRAVPTDYTLNFTYSGIDQAQAIRVLDMKDSIEIDYNNTAVQADGPDYTFVKATTSTVALGAPVAATRSSAAATVDAGVPVAATRSAAATSSTSSAKTATVTKRSTSSDIPLRLKGLTEMDIDVSNITTLAQHALRLSSWAAIQEAAMALVLGATNSYNGPPGYALLPAVSEGGGAGSQSYSSEVFATVLLYTQELSRLRTVDPTANNITDTASGLAYDQAASLLANTSTHSDRPFKDVLEELFLNITLSMASSKELIYNSNSPLAPEKVEITQDLYGNVYSYAMDKLWLAYGIAIGVCVLNVVVGFVAVFTTGASFTDNFSTITRMARNATIEADLSESRLAGKDPLPRHLAKAEMRLRKADALLLDIKHLGSVTVSEGRHSNDFVR